MRKLFRVLSLLLLAPAAALAQSNPFLGTVQAVNSPPAGVASNPYLGTVVFLNGVPSGLASARPSSGCVLGQEYFATDTPKLYVASAADTCSWVDVSTLGGVTSFNTRTGAVTPQSGDYTASQVGLGSVTNDAQTKASIVPNTAPSAGQILVGNAGGTAYARQTVSGDCTISSAGALTCTKTNGSSFATVATSASATDLTTGTLNASRLPASAVQTIASGSSALGTSSINSGACATVVSPSATGVVTTDNVIADFNADPSAVTGYAPVTTGTLIIYKYPTADHANFKVCNPTASSITPGAVTLNWRVLR